MTTWKYMPILKWKKGEQLALRYLSPQQRAGMMPLIELQPIDSAPTALTDALPGYMAKASDQITSSIPNHGSFCLDSSYLSLGYPRQVNLLMLVVGYLQKHLPHTIIPVIHATDLESIDQLAATPKKILEQQDKVVLRLRTDQIDSSQVIASVASMSGAGIGPERIHLLVDQSSMVGRNVTDCVAQVKPYLDVALTAGCTSLTLAGGSFPVNLVGIPQGVTNLPRVEWKAWETVVAEEKYKDVIFADYAVTNPDLGPEIDPRQMNASITIRYAGKDSWRLYKGRGFKSKVPGEYRNLCRLLVSDGIFSGEKFSYGDGQYHQKASTGNEKNGNPASWRKEATSHHIVLTASCL